MVATLAYRENNKLPNVIIRDCSYEVIHLRVFFSLGLAVNKLD